MNLRQQKHAEEPWYLHPEETTRASQTADTFHASDPAVPPRQDARYEPAAVERILARAGALQEVHQQMLTPAQIEAIAAEIGIGPEFVHQALKQEAAAVIVAPRAVEAVVEPTRTLSASRAFAAVIAYGIASTFLLTPLRGPLDEKAIPFLCFFLPALLALAFGAMLAQRRAGAVTGIALAGAAIMAAGISHQLTSGNVSVTEEDIKIFAGMFASGAALGFTGAEVRRQMVRRRSKRRS